MPPTLLLAKTLWGVDGADDPSRWPTLFARIKSEGFSAVEAIAPAYRQPGFCKAVEDAGLQLICQIHTTGGDIVDGEYVYCSSCKLEDHIASFKALTLSPTLASPTSRSPSLDPNPDKALTRTRPEPYS